ncbi:MAG: hypothetical protein PHW04_06495 [Candidatus Wallbacteria bacterium]|nr:hypothetical protein [Candidatus Wallbacteria bacterium]
MDEKHSLNVVEKQPVTQSQHEENESLAVFCMTVVIFITYPILVIGYSIMAGMDMDVGNKAVPVLSLLAAFILCPALGFLTGKKISAAVWSKKANIEQEDEHNGQSYGSMFGLLIGGIVGTAICPVLVMGVATLNYSMLSGAIVLGTGPGLVIGMVIGSIVGRLLESKELKRKQKLIADHGDENG